MAHSADEIRLCLFRVPGLQAMKLCQYNVAECRHVLDFALLGEKPQGRVGVESAGRVPSLSGMIPPVNESQRSAHTRSSMRDSSLQHTFQRVPSFLRQERVVLSLSNHPNGSVDAALNTSHYEVCRQLVCIPVGSDKVAHPWRLNTQKIHHHLKKHLHAH